VKYLFYIILKVAQCSRELQTAEECDATKAESSNEDGIKK
jgi:hypothetical protein